MIDVLVGAGELIERGWRWWGIATGCVGGIIVLVVVWDAAESWWERRGTRQRLQEQAINEVTRVTREGLSHLVAADDMTILTQWLLRLEGDAARAQREWSDRLTRVEGKIGKIRTERGDLSLDHKVLEILMSQRAKALDSEKKK